MTLHASCVVSAFANFTVRPYTFKTETLGKADKWFMSHTKVQNVLKLAIKSHPQRDRSMMTLTDHKLHTLEAIFWNNAKLPLPLRSARARKDGILLCQCSRAFVWNDAKLPWPHIRVSVRNNVKLPTSRIKLIVRDNAKLPWSCISVIVRDDVKLPRWNNRKNGRHE